jgi:predicted anti-sigma-YlaC factor YlaD
VSEDEFVEYDGAYVLGALAPDEREAFEVHLLECDDCRARVAELADLPDLLALIPVSAYAEPPAQPDPVVTLLAVARARRNRRRWVTAGIAAAAAACLIAGTAAITNNSTPTRPRAAASIPQVTMSALAAAPIHATVALNAVAWGTSIRVTCTYDQAVSYPPDEQYSLMVRSRTGQTENLGTWALVPGKVTTFPAGTALDQADIESISIDTADGTPLLQVSY